MNRMALKAVPGIALAVALLVFVPKPGAAAEPQPDERTAVEELVTGINSARSENKPAALEALLSGDLSPAERAAIVESEKVVCEAARQILSELTVPQLNIRTLRLITPDVVEVDAANVQFGFLIVSRRRNVLLI
jgi:hypothetical protein